MEKYTAIYVDSWMSGSHRHSLTKMLRFEKKPNQTMRQAVESHIDEVDFDSVVFIFHGHSMLVDENDSKM